MTILKLIASFVSGNILVFYILFPLQTHIYIIPVYDYSTLMSEFRELFMKSSDKSIGGIMHFIDLYSRALKETDVEVWTQLKRQGIEHSFYSFRWFTTLLTRYAHVILIYIVNV